MQLLLPTNKVPLTLVLGIRTKKPENISIQISDNKKPSTTYISRVSVVDGYREFYLNLPLSPKVSVLTIYNTEVGNKNVNVDKSFSVDKIKSENLENCPVWMNNESSSFVKFAQQFSENASILSAGERSPSIYRSDDAKFHIDYYNKIIDKKTGEVLHTPARIGHTSGIIEVSKSDFIKYTVPMRMIILLHEYAHKYLNPKTNRPIAYEIGADINALNIYLGLGFPPSEAHYAFLHVFKEANNEQNAKRYRVINDFIDKFTRGEIKGSCKMRSNNGNK